MAYTEELKTSMVSRMLSGTSATALSKETGVPQPTLSTWFRNRSRLRGVKSGSPTPRRPEDWTPEEKLRAVNEAGSVPDAELGAWLRRNGLHEAQLEAWRRAALEGLAPQKPTAKRSAEARRVRELERELQRKEKALAEAAALLMLRKKAEALWGDEDDATEPKSDDKSSS